MTRIALLFIIFLHSPARATFTNSPPIFNKRDCSINGSTFLPWGEDEVTNISFKLQFSKKAPTLPRVTLKFSNWTPKKVSLRWETVQGALRSLPRKLRRSLRLESGKIFPMQLENSNNSGEPSTWRSLPMGLLRSQHFVLLLISQKTLNISVSGKDRQYPDIILPLSGSSREIKKMAYHCFPGLREPLSKRKYLVATGRSLRINVPYSRAISHSYGLTSYGDLEKYLPESIRFPNPFFKENEPDSIADQEERLIKAAQLLKKKDGLLRVVNKLFKRNNLSYKIRRLKRYLTKAKIVSEQIIELDNGSDEGLIPGIKQAISLLETKLRLINENLDSLRKKEKPQAKDKIATISTKINPHLLKIKVFEQQIDLAKKDLHSTITKIKQSKALLSKYSRWVKQQSLNFESQKINQEIPSRKIKKINIEQNERLARIAILQTLEAQISKASERVAPLIGLAEKLHHSFSQYIEARSLPVKQQNKVMVIDQKLQRWDKVFPSSVRMNFSKWHKTTESSIKDSLRERTYGDEKYFTIELLLNSYSAFEEKISSEDIKEHPLFSKILCSWIPTKKKNKVRKKHTSCVSFKNIQNEEQVTEFLTQLSSTKLNSLLIISTGDAANSWPTKRQNTKIEFLRERLFLETDRLDLLSYKKMWENIEWARWRYRTLKRIKKRHPSGKGLTYTASLYQKVYDQDTQRIKNYSKTKDKHLTEIIKLNESLAYLQSQYQEDDTQYTLLSKAFYKDSMNPIQKKLLLAKAQLSLKNCDLILENPKLCLAKQNQLSAKIPQKISDEQQIYFDTSRSLITSIQTQLQELAVLKKTTLSRILKFESESLTYYRENDIELALKEKSLLEKELENMETRLLYLERSKKKKQMVVAENSSLLEKYEVKLAKWTKRMLRIEKRMSPFKKIVQSTCQKLKLQQKDLAKVNSQIHHYFFPSRKHIPTTEDNICELFSPTKTLID